MKRGKFFTVIAITFLVVAGVLSKIDKRGASESELLFGEMTEALSWEGDLPSGSTCRGSHMIGGALCRSISKSDCYIYVSTGQTRMGKEIIGGDTITFVEELKREELRELDVCVQVSKNDADRYDDCNDYRSCEQLDGSETSSGEYEIWERKN